jgi:SAM-dependent methyltransferase
MTAALDFEARRFQSAAAHYLAGRPPYPEALIARTAELVGLGPGDRLMDLGCGPAQLALAFAPRVGRVLAIDPEPAMLEVAREEASAFANVEVQAGRSDDLGPGMGRFKAVVIGRAFHWMDRETTLAVLDGMIEPDGAVALFGEEHLRIPENARIHDYYDWLETFSTEDSTRRRILSDAYRPHTSVMLGSPFSRLERIAVIERRTVTLQELTDRALSLSSTSRARLGDKADELVAELGRKFRAWEAQAPMEEVLSSSALIARRP